MNPLDVGLQPQGDGRTPGTPAGCSGGSARTYSSTETAVPQSCVCLMVQAPAELPDLAGGHPGPGGKKLFWSVAHAWVGASPSWREGEHRGALTLLSQHQRLGEAQMVPLV